MSGNNVPAQDEEEPVATEKERSLHLQTAMDDLPSLTTPISVKEWLNNVEEFYEKAEGPAPPIPPRNPRRLQLLIRKEPTYDELEVSPGSDGSKTGDKSWPKNNDSGDPVSARKEDDESP
ncbi:hypothetical protein G7054_g8966 [Neopestalotiopsis clavispora]|nr:hypothetical protein G7054_g8966 [Neopestalotiopsis clavispora]